VGGGGGVPQIFELFHPFEVFIISLYSATSSCLLISRHDRVLSFICIYLKSTLLISTEHSCAISPSSLSSYKFSPVAPSLATHNSLFAYHATLSALSNLAIPNASLDTNGRPCPCPNYEGRWRTEVQSIHSSSGIRWERAVASRPGRFTRRNTESGPEPVQTFGQEKHLLPLPGTAT